MAIYKISKAALELATKMTSDKSDSEIAEIIQSLTNPENLDKHSTDQLCVIYDEICKIAARRGVCLECWENFSNHNDDGFCIEA